MPSWPSLMTLSKRSLLPRIHPHLVILFSLSIAPRMGWALAMRILMKAVPAVLAVQATVRDLLKTKLLYLVLRP